MHEIQPTWSVRSEYREHGAGWVTFAGVMLFIVGSLNLMQGLVLLSGDEIYSSGSDAEAVVIGDTTTWGWVIFLIGVLEAFAGAGVLSRRQWARWFGVVVASIGLLGQFPVFFGDHPLWSLMIVAICASVVYGLVVYGGSENAPNDTIPPKQGIHQ